jgi:hypothetical protein
MCNFFLSIYIQFGLKHKLLKPDEAQIADICPLYRFSCGLLEIAFQNDCAFVRNKQTNEVRDSGVIKMSPYTYCVCICSATCFG